MITKLLAARMRFYYVLASVLCIAWPSLDAVRGEQFGNVHFRGNLNNSRIQFERNQTGHVAFLGGSITEMNGYRPMVCEILTRRFPKTEFKFTDAGIASTCSTTGAFRLQRDVLSAGPVDLLFVEFAVNDDQDAGHAARECIRGMEGIIRHVRRHNPYADIVVTHFTNPEMIETLQGGDTPLSSGSHERVAEHYRVSTIDLAREVAERMTAGRLTWKEFGGTHPAPRGNRLCADMIDALLTEAWSRPLPSDVGKTPHELPVPIDPGNYGTGDFISPNSAKSVRGWELRRPDWKSLPGSSRRRFAELSLLCADEAGAELELKFDGTAVGAYLLAGPDAGTVLARIDDGPTKSFDLYHRFSSGLHYPRTVMFATDLHPGTHTLTLTVADTKNLKSVGHAVRILDFAVLSP
jgi:lysophospholipase L1-like esterase